MSEASTLTRSATSPKPSVVTYGRGTLVGEITHVADVTKATTDFYLHGKDPAVKTADELENRQIKIGEELTPTQKEYMAKRDYLFTAKNFSKDLITDVLETRITELKDAIQRAPLKSAATREDNTLGNLLEMTTLAQKELGGDMQSKSVLKNVLTNIIVEEKSEIDYVTSNATKTGMIHDRNGKATAYQVLDKDQRGYAQGEIKRVNENFVKGKIRLQEYIKAL